MLWIKKKTDESGKPNAPSAMQDIAPLGGISFRDPRYVNTGTGYEACLTVTSYPGSGLTDHWLSTLMNIKGTVGLVQVTTEDPTEVQQNLAKSMKEQNLRFAGTEDAASQTDARARFNELKELYDQLAIMGEVIKSIYVKIYLCDRTVTGLEHKLDDTMAKLEAAGYENCILLNETKYDFVSTFQTLTENSTRRPFPVDTAPLQSAALASGDPFHFSCLEDPYGDYMGSTPCGGNVVFDEFHIGKLRTYYNGVVIGNMGSGKSTLLKKRLVARALRGDFVRVFDITGEFSQLVRALGGKIIRMDGTDGILNPLEILTSGETDEISYMRHISKVETIYRFLSGNECGRDELVLLGDLLKQLYDEAGVTGEGKTTCGLPPESYPVLSDLTDIARRRKDEMAAKEDGTEGSNELVRNEIKTLQKIEQVFSQASENFSTIFNGHSSIANIGNEQIVSFDMSHVKEFKPEIFDAAIFNIVSFCWDNCVVNGKAMKDLYETGKIGFEDVTRFLILIDESHRWLNINKLFAVEQITIYMREARKFFGGIVLASQSIRDFVPDGADSASTNMMKVMFELTQYKWIFRQDANVTELLGRIFQGVLTDSQKESISTLEKGQCFLCTGEENIRMSVFLSREEEKLFAGGV